MSFTKKISGFFLGLFFSAIIIFILFSAVGIISIPRLYAGHILKEKAEEYVKASYGDHYYVSNTHVDSNPSFLPFQEEVWGIEYTFSDKNRQEDSFVIYVGNDSGNDKTITDKRYYASNERAYKNSVNNYIGDYFKKYGISEKEYRCDISVEDAYYAMYTNYLLEYGNYEQVIADETGIISKLDVSLYITFGSQKPDDKCIYGLYEYLNKARYGTFRFALIGLDENAGKMDIDAGVSHQGQTVQNPALEREIYIDPYYTEYYDVKYNNIGLLKTS